MRDIRLIGVMALGTLAAAVVAGPLLAQAPAAPAGPVRVDIAGEWAVTTNEDQPHRAPGAELGDYTGLPINDAARQKAEAWDASVLSQPERQAQAHPVQYHMRGPGPNLRILKVLDPVTQVQVAYTMAGHFGRADRIIYIDGRNHPSDYSEHTWDGYSTGSWDESGQFNVVTTHMKYGVINRNGVPASPYGVLREHFSRHGLYMVSLFFVDDPIYVEEPMVRSQTWTWDPSQNLELGQVFQSVDELGDRPLGWVPHWALGTLQLEFSQAHDIPFKATIGGKESIYPEFMDKIREFRAEEAAQKAEAAKKAAAAAAPPARRR
ncbi:MAG: hypothetical protein WBD07_15840 [Vicinamibacterales bacterium]